MVLLLLILILEGVLAFGIAHFLRVRTRWSNLRVALGAALPVPLLLVGVAIYFAGYDRLVQSIDGQPMDLAITLSIGATILYLIGFAIAVTTARKGTQPPAARDEVADVFR